MEPLSSINFVDFDSFFNKTPNVHEMSTLMQLLSNLNMTNSIKSAH